MKAISLYQDGSHQWMIFGRDPNRDQRIVDTNQYMVMSHEESMLIDPGGIELFSQMLTSVLKYTTLDNITALFASHPGPDMISGLNLWSQCLKDTKLYSSSIWESFIRHLSMSNIEFEAIEDKGDKLKLGNIMLEFIPAHYLYSSGSFNIYDPKAKLLMSGEIGSALINERDVPIFVEDFESHAPKMEYFHQRWMPSNRAKEEWINRVRKLDIDIMAPQHGPIFKGEMITQFLDWFERLDVGSASNK